MLKFDIAHSHAIYHKKEMNVRESPTGQVKHFKIFFQSKDKLTDKQIYKQTDK